MWKCQVHGANACLCPSIYYFDPAETPTGMWRWRICANEKFLLKAKDSGGLLSGYHLRSNLESFFKLSCPLLTGIAGVGVLVRYTAKTELVTNDPLFGVKGKGF